MEQCVKTAWYQLATPPLNERPWTSGAAVPTGAGRDPAHTGTLVRVRVTHPLREDGRVALLQHVLQLLVRRVLAGWNTGQAGVTSRREHTT